jgi:hypothetical protein
MGCFCLSRKMVVYRVNGAMALWSDEVLGLKRDLFAYKSFNTPIRQYFTTTKDDEKLLIPH